MSEKTITAPKLKEKKFNAGAFFQKYTMIIALVVVTLVFNFWKGKEGLILMPSNITGLIAENGYVFVLAAGMLMCILTGGNIDLSVGSVVCFTAAIGCNLMVAGWPWWVTVLAMLAIGGLIGAFQGFWIAKLKVPAFIATLAGMYAFRGLTNVVLDGMRVDVSNQTFLDLFGNGKTSYLKDFVRGWFPGLENILKKDNVKLANFIGPNYIAKFNVTCMAIFLIAAIVFAVLRITKLIKQKKLGIAKSVPAQIISTVIIAALLVWVGFKFACYRGFPLVLIWIALVLGICNYVTNNVRMGRHLYAVGGNEKAAELSGVKIGNVYWFAYAIIGMMAGLAGVLTAARAKGIDPVYGEGYEMDAIAACFIGGASAYGGSGKISGMIIVGVDANYQKVVKGIVLLLAVLFDVLSKRKKK